MNLKVVFQRAWEKATGCNQYTPLGRYGRVYLSFLKRFSAKKGERALSLAVPRTAVMNHKIKLVHAC